MAKSSKKLIHTGVASTATLSVAEDKMVAKAVARLSGNLTTRSDVIALREGCYFDEAKATAAIDWIEDRFHVKLLQWQRNALWRYFGWRKKDGSYRDRKSVV